MIGKTLGHYQVGEQLGRGGMGEVYVADDTALDRKVALKFLPDAFANDPERMARFEREGKLLASLNHPNIAAIHGLEQAEGKRFIVMELVKGETLGQKLSKGPLPIDEALAICRQIAEGLEAAHEKGVIHRDLKPANVMITEGDKVKILDFGLAKALSDETQSVDSSHSPTITEAMTRPGMILGTAAYMSPEQAKGKTIDKRADIWAFGCILYECLTGKRAFEGETVTEMLAGILKSEPDWHTLPTTTPSGIRVVLRRCLEKNVNSRFHCVADLRIAIEEALTNAEPITPKKKSRAGFAWSMAGAAALIAVVLGFLKFSEKPVVEVQPMRFQISIPGLMTPSMFGTFAISPDGRHLALTGISADGASRIWLRRFDSLEAKPLLGTESSDVFEFCFWSPDSRSIAFNSGGKLRKIDVSGGPARTICDLPGNLAGGSWNQDDVIVFADYTSTKGILRVSATGGTPSSVTRPDSRRQETRHMFPVFLSDGRHFLYYSVSNTAGKNGMLIGSIDFKPEEQDSRCLTADSGMATYMPLAGSNSGRLLFLRGQTLLSQPLDEQKLLLTGEALPIADPVGSIMEYGLFSASANGVLIYRQPVESRPAWIDRTGRELESIGEPGTYPTFDLSKDSKRLVVSKTQADGHQNLWVIDVLRGSMTRLTLEGADHVDPRWSPDGTLVMFGSTRDPSRSPFQISASGSNLTQVFKFTGKMFGLDDWSPDGRHILYHDNGPDLWALPLFGERKPELIRRALSGAVDQARFSPDGRWIAYNTEESGRYEVEVVPFPPTGDKWQISTSGGAQPTWRADGREMYYLTPDNTLVAVDIHPEKKLEWGKPNPLFKAHIPVNYQMEQYLPARDGSRFLFMRPIPDQIRAPFTVVLNWTSLLKK